MNKMQRKMVKDNILKSFIKLIDSKPELKDDPEIDEAYKELKSDLSNSMLIGGKKVDF